MWKHYRLPISLSIAALSAFVLLAAMPALMVSMLKPMAKNDVRVWESAPTLVQYRNDQGQLITGSATWVRSLITEPLVLDATMIERLGGDKKAEAKAKDRVHATVDEALSSGETELLNIHDELYLVRHSTYPSLEPISTMTVSVPSANWLVTTKEFVRDGLQYFLPFSAERKSYPYFDPYAQDTIALDYEYTTEEGYLVYHHIVDPVDVFTSTSRAHTHPDIISDQIPEDDATSKSTRDRAFYTAERTVTVEPRSGEILNIDTTLFFYTADSPDTVVAPGSAETLLHASFEWSANTKAAALSRATPVLRALFVMELGKVVLQVATWVLMGLAIFMFVKKRRALS